MAVAKEQLNIRELNNQINSLTESVELFKKSFSPLIDDLTKFKKQLGNSFETKIKNNSLETISDDLDQVIKVFEKNNRTGISAQDIKDLKKSFGTDKNRVKEYIQQFRMTFMQSSMIQKLFGTEFKNVLSESIKTALSSNSINFSIDSSLFSNLTDAITATNKQLTTEISSLKNSIDNLKVNTPQQNNSQIPTNTNITSVPLFDKTATTDILESVKASISSEKISLNLTSIIESIINDQVTDIKKVKKDDTLVAKIIESLKKKFENDKNDLQLQLNISDLFSTLLTKVQDEIDINHSTIQSISNNLITALAAVTNTKDLQDKIVIGSDRYGQKDKILIPINTFLPEFHPDDIDEETIIAYKSIQKTVVEKVKNKIDKLNDDKIIITKDDRHQGKISVEGLVNVDAIFKSGNYKISKDVQDNLNKIRSLILTKIQDKIEDLSKPSSNPTDPSKELFTMEGDLNLSSFLPRDNKVSGTIINAYRALQSKILNRILELDKTQLEDKISVKDSRISLNTIIPTDIKATKAIGIEYNNIRTKILSKIKPLIDTKIRLNKEISVSDLLMQNAPDTTVGEGASLLRYFQSVPRAYTSLRKKILDKISAQISPNDITFDIDKDISLSQFLTEGSSNELLNLFNNIPWNLARIKGTLLKKIKDEVNKTDFSIEMDPHVSITDFLTEGERNTPLLMPFGNTISSLKRSLIGKIKDEVKDAKFEFEPISVNELLGLNKSNVITDFFFGGGKDLNKLRIQKIKDLLNKVNLPDFNSNKEQTKQNKKQQVDPLQNIIPKEDNLPELEYLKSIDHTVNQILSKNIELLTYTTKTTKKVQQSSIPQIDKLAETQLRDERETQRKLEDDDRNKSNNLLENIAKLIKAGNVIKNEVKKDDKSSFLDTIKSLASLKSILPMLSSLGGAITAAAPILATAAGVGVVLAGTAYVGYLGKKLIEQNAENKLQAANLDDLNAVAISERKRKRENKVMVQATQTGGVTAALTNTRIQAKKTAREKILRFQMGFTDEKKINELLNLSDDEFEKFVKSHKGQNESGKIISGEEVFDLYLKDKSQTQRAFTQKAMKEYNLSGEPPPVQVEPEVIAPVNTTSAEQQLQTQRTEANDNQNKQLMMANELSKQMINKLDIIANKPQTKLVNIISPTVRKGLV